MRTLGETGEIEAIRRLTAGLGTASSLRVGAGDDCAVTRLPGGAFDQLLTSDPVIEGVHFLAAEDPVRVGRKAVGRVLSDLAAMGGRPQWMVVDVVAPVSFEMERLEAVYRGMIERCDAFDATIVGGDLARGERFELHVFATGLVPAGQALLRSGAAAGDVLMTTGALGCSRRGKHLDFLPRVEEGIFLRESGAVSAMMDSSDGLATDLRHLLAASGVGARLDVPAIPKNGTLEEALFDGEDFELLCSVRAEAAEELEASWSKRFADLPLSRIGVVLPSAEALCLDFRDGRAPAPLEGSGFEHFKGGGP